MPFSAGSVQHQLAAVLLRAEVDHERRAPVDELLRLLLLRLDHRVHHGDLQGGLLGGHGDRLHADQVGQPLLQPGLDGLLLRRGQHVAVGREDQLRRAAAEGRDG